MSVTADYGPPAPASEDEAEAQAAYGLVPSLSLLGGVRAPSSPDRQPPDRAP